ATRSRPGRPAGARPRRPPSLRLGRPDLRRDRAGARRAGGHRPLPAQPRPPQSSSFAASQRGQRHRTAAAGRRGGTPMDELTALREFRPLHELPSATTVEAARYALLRHISGRGARSRRLSWKLPAAVATVAAIVVAAVLLSGLAPTSGTEARAASGVLRQTAAVAAGREPVTLPPGAYAYSRSRGVHPVTTVIGGKAFNALVPSVREIWIARHGSRRIRR